MGAGKRRRQPNYRLVKIHRTYSVDDAAKALEVHRNTIRDWINNRGLATLDDRRPTLIRGAELAAFLHRPRATNKRRSRPGQFYCLRCRATRDAAGSMAEYRPRTATLGNLVAICPTCERFMYRGVNPSKLEQIRGDLDVSFPVAMPRLDETQQPSLNRDFTTPNRPTDEIQRGQRTN